MTLNLLILSEILSQAFEKVGIFIDILRLYLILVVMQNYPSDVSIKKNAGAKLVFILMNVALFIFVIAINSLIFKRENIIEHFIQEMNKDKAIYEYNIILNAVFMLHSMITNIYVIASYSVIYYRLFKISKLINEEAESDKDKEIPAKI